MDHVTPDEMMRLCALQAVRIEKLQEHNRNLSVQIEANNQQIIKLVEDKNAVVQELEEMRCKMAG